ncbi:C1 family peptidase [Rhizobium leguminosarum]|uniref:C1 family peptidase n=1 Tax=Rhizobium leguminosarum TaxID=384 RepID=UPI001FF050DE|nr:C1 family peptidase [Rhizobium leguminosarum]
MALLRDPSVLRCLPRDQGEEGSCASQALAAVIDLQKTFKAESATDLRPVSARMLSVMAERHSDRPDRGVSLRDVIKGFYHNGVCPDSVWPYEPLQIDEKFNVERSKAAREICLGTYFRLRPSLNDYHSAINEVGPILVSAWIHAGWKKDAVRRASGKIVPVGDTTEAHAFVIVGYDDTGFIVLNSWGSAWGGFDKCKGVAHWSYNDWADTIMDGWVLRLGVPAPTVFPLSIGEQGIYFAATNFPVRSTPAHELTGHLLHLDDGETFNRAPYPTSLDTMAETIRYLRRDQKYPSRPIAPLWREATTSLPAEGYRGIFLNFAGSINGINVVADQVAKDKTIAKSHGLYPITVSWCADTVEESDRVLAQIFLDSEAQVQKRGDDLNLLIELRTHGVGRAFWRDVENAAMKSSRPHGPVFSLVEDILSLSGYSIHCVCDGAGVLVLSELVKSTAQADPKLYRKLVSRISSLDLITPVIDVRAFETVFSDLLERAGQKPGLVRLHVPSTKDEGRLCVGAYTKPILSLIENSFVSRMSPKPNFLGKSAATVTKIDPDAFSGPNRWIARSDINVGNPKTGPIRQQDLHSKTKLMENIFQAINSTLTPGGEDNGKKDYARRTKR